MADYSHTAMDRRKSKLLESEVMVAAIWLDPRYRHKMLHDSNKFRKSKVISNIWEKIKFNKNHQTTEEQNRVPILPVPVTKPKVTLQSDDEFNADRVSYVKNPIEPQMQSQPKYSKDK